jgi:hypothetical protein
VRRASGFRFELETAVDERAIKKLPHDVSYSIDL